MENQHLTQVKVFHGNGAWMTLAEWQDSYGLPVGSDKIGHYYSVYGDYKLEKDLIQYGELIVCAPLIILADRVRKLWGRPLKLNDFNRTQEKQDLLRAKGYPAGKYSAHVVKMALDFDTHTNAESLELAKVIEQASKELGIPVRIGVQKYINHPFTLVHVDVAPLYYAPSGVYHHRDHPKAWEKEVRF